MTENYVFVLIIKNVNIIKIINMIKLFLRISKKAYNFLLLLYQVILKHAIDSIKACSGLKTHV